MKTFLAAMGPLLLLCDGCGSGAPLEPTTPEPVASAHRAGDFVLYRYSGRFTDSPVELREDVFAADGLRLSIRVVATRGDERREWIQVVTDTPENRADNVVDELWEVVEGERRRLPNEENADLLRLYDWTLPPCGPPAERLATEERERTIGGEAMRCTCEVVRMRCSGEPATLTTCECPDFLWGHGFGEAIADAAEEPIWRVEVVRHGREP